MGGERPRLRRGPLSSGDSRIGVSTVTGREKGVRTGGALVEERVVRLGASASALAFPFPFLSALSSDLLLVLARLGGGTTSGEGSGGGARFLDLRLKLP